MIGIVEREYTCEKMNGWNFFTSLDGKGFPSFWGVQKFQFSQRVPPVFSLRY